MPPPIFSCHKCAEVIPLASGDKVGRRDTCPKCSADLHCCRNCKHYDPHVNNQCRETQAEWVRYKDEANHCDYFQPLMAAARGAGRGSSSSNQARKKFDDLFKS